MAHVSNAYLSQIERGMHAPSLRVMRALANVLEVPVEDLVRLSDSTTTPPSGTTVTSSEVEVAIKRDARLTEPHKAALLAVYRSYVDAPPSD